MKYTLADIEKMLRELESSILYVRQARREARKILDHDDEIRANLKCAYEDAQKFCKMLEGPAGGL